MYKHLLALIDSSLSYVLQCAKDLEVAEMAYKYAEALIEEYRVINLEPYLVHSSYLVGANLYCLKKDYKKALDLLGKYGNLCDDKYFSYRFKGDSFFIAINEWLESDYFVSLM